MSDSASVVLAHLTDGRTSVVITGDGGMPVVAHWGAPLGPAALDPAALERMVPGGGLDVDPPVGVVAEATGGWFGRPGIEGFRGAGVDFAPRFLVESSSSDGSVFTAELSSSAGLALALRLALTDAGTVTVDAALTNTGATPYRLSAFRLAVPVPAHATEILTFGGRWADEFVEQRRAWIGAVAVENRHGKTSHERSPSIIVGSTGFGEQRGEVWGLHLAWSGNYDLHADAITDGRRVVQAGELLLPGEVTLDPDERYVAPTVHGAYSSVGMGEMSSAFHRWLRSRPHHPTSPRPVHLNTWEAVYFDHDLDTLRRLADAAAEIGIERFVLDDGWFGSRRDDTSGLGDWVVSADAWPNGLSPLIDHVRGLGMEFGIWVEPEMVNPDSDLYRAHPDWVLAERVDHPVLGRHQLVLDIGRPDVADLIFERLDALVRDHDIAYLKWDHNRDLVAPVSHDGRAGAHRQTLAVYALLDRLRAAHPGLDIESCASGGGRIDFGILDRTDRVWTSDSIDALDRLSIQRGYSRFFPPELMGSHIGAPTAHITGRHHRLGLRAASALFGAFGVEWDLLSATDDDRRRLARVIELHKTHRRLLHSGIVMRPDHPDPAVDAHGVVATDRGEALVAVTRLRSTETLHTAPLRWPGLDPDRTYTVRIVDLGEPSPEGRRPVGWVDDGLALTGRQLAHLGVNLPQVRPETALVLHIVAS